MTEDWKPGDRAMVTVRGVSESGRVGLHGHMATFDPECIEPLPAAGSPFDPDLLDDMRHRLTGIAPMPMSPERLERWIAEAERCAAPEGLSLEQMCDDLAAFGQVSVHWLGTGRCEAWFRGQTNWSVGSGGTLAAAIRDLYAATVEWCEAVAAEPADLEVTVTVPAERVARYVDGSFKHGDHVSAAFTERDAVLAALDAEGADDG